MAAYSSWLREHSVWGSVDDGAQLASLKRWINCEAPFSLFRCLGPTIDSPSFSPSLSLFLSHFLSLYYSRFHSGKEQSWLVRLVQLLPTEPAKRSLYRRTWSCVDILPAPVLSTAERKTGKEDFFFKIDLNFFVPTIDDALFIFLSFFFFYSIGNASV